ncbi:MAG: hypothetical protein ACI857_000821 [Arenicella sp.]|jgi:hypothetical protein
MKTTLLIATFFLFGFYSKAQDRAAYFVQFKINKITSELEAKTIDKKLSGKKGILSTKSDHITSTYFCTLSAEAEYSFDEFESWFHKLGYEISCFNKGLHGNGGMKSPHELKNCVEINNTE